VNLSIFTKTFLILNNFIYKKGNFFYSSRRSVLFHFYFVRIPWFLCMCVRVRVCACVFVLHFDSSVICLNFSNLLRILQHWHNWKTLHSYNSEYLTANNKNLDNGRNFVGRATLSQLGLGPEIIQDKNHKNMQIY